MRENRKGIFITVAVLMMLWLTAFVNADAKEKDVFPSKPITIIVPYPPGGSIDMVPRTLAIYMGQYLKTSIIISNVPGAAGVIGNTKAYTANPDGYTMLCWHTMPALLEEYRREVMYKTLNFTAIAGISSDFTIIVGHPDGSKNIQDFVKQAKEHAVSIASNGPASITGFQARLMAEELGMKVNWVNYSSAEGMTALAGKHIDASATMTGSAMPLIRAGKIIPLLIFAKNRYPKFPTVPVPNELGFKFPLIGSHLAIVGPPGMNKERVKILENAILKAAVHPDYVAWSNKTSAGEPALMSAEAYRTELEKFDKVARDYKRFLVGD